MVGLGEQTAAALQQTEIEFCRLRARREAIEMSLDEKTSSKDSFQVDHLRSELRSVSEQMASTHIELFQHRIALLKLQLPEDKDAIAPAQRAFDQADQRYLEAARERETAAIALHVAQTKVGTSESNIDFYERSIKGLKQTLEHLSKGSPERSAGEIASELSSLEKRLGQLKAISSELSPDS